MNPISISIIHITPDSERLPCLNGPGSLEHNPPPPLSLNVLQVGLTRVKHQGLDREDGPHLEPDIDISHHSNRYQRSIQHHWLFSVFLGPSISPVWVDDS